LMNFHSSRLIFECRMDPFVVRRVKILWAVAGLCVTGVALVGWGFHTAVIAALSFVGASILTFVAFVLFLLLGDTHVAFRILLIVLFLVGLVVEVCGIAGVFGSL
jgi:hypothetical protein